MKQIKFITVMLLLAALTFSFNACSSDDDDDVSYQETLKKYENSTFEGYRTNWVWDNKEVTIKFRKVELMHDGYRLFCSHTRIENTYISYNKKNKSYYFSYTTTFGQEFNGPWIEPVQFIDENTIIINGTKYTRKL